MKLGHVCHAKVAKVAAAIPGPVLAPLALFPHIPAAGPAVMFSAIDSLLDAARLAPALDSARKPPRSLTDSDAQSAATAAYRTARESAPGLARSLMAPAQALADLKQLRGSGEPGHSSCTASTAEQASPTAEEEPMAEAEGGAVACLPVSCRSELVVTFAKAAPCRSLPLAQLVDWQGQAQLVTRRERAVPVVVPLGARGTPQGPVDSRALGVDSPEFGHKPAQDEQEEQEEQEAEMTRLVKKDPAVRQEQPPTVAAVGGAVEVHAAHCTAYGVLADGLSSVLPMAAVVHDLSV